MTHERERELAPAIPVTVTFRRDTLDRIGEAAALLGLSVEAYCGIAAVVAAKEDLGRKDLLRLAGAEK